MTTLGGWIDSPYVGICIRPRATIRSVVNRDPRDKVIPLVVIDSLIGPIWNLIHPHKPPTPMPYWIGGKLVSVTIPDTLWLVIWPLGAILLLYLNGALIQRAGSLLRGTAKPAEVRAALAWPTVLSIIMAPLPLLTGIGTSSPLHFLAVWRGWSPLPSPLPAVGVFKNLPAYWLRWLPTIIVGTPLWLWHFIIKIKCIGEVHRFSAWRGMGAWFMGSLMLFVVLAIVHALFAVAIAPFLQ